MKTSKMQERVSQFLGTHFGKYTIRENYMADWLITPDGGRLQLDFYIEELNKAIEVQGIQHFRFTPHFHITEAGFERRLYLDAFKRDACATQDIELVEICDEADVINLLKLIPEDVDRPFIPTDMAAMRKMYVKTRGEEKARVRVTEKTKTLHHIMRMLADAKWTEEEHIVLSSWAIRCMKKINMREPAYSAIQRQYGVSLEHGHGNFDGELKKRITECSFRLRPIVFNGEFAL